MSELETTIRQSAEAGDWVADWDDVLRRAGRSRIRSRRAAAIGAVVAVAVVLLLPGIGIGGGLNALISGSGGAGFELRARLSHGGRVIGTVSVRTSRLFVAVDPKSGRIRSFFPRGLGHLPRPESRWRIDLTGVTAVTSARIVQRGRVVVQLCERCSDGAHGRFRADRLGLAAIFGRGTVVAETPQGPTRGPLELQNPSR